MPCEHQLRTNIQGDTFCYYCGMVMDEPEPEHEPTRTTMANRFKDKVENMPDWAFVTSAFSLILAVVLILCTVCSYFEAKAYNRITGSEVTTFEAFFVNLHVEGSLK